MRVGGCAHSAYAPCPGADKGGLHRVVDLSQTDSAGAPYPYRQQLVIRKAECRQRTEVLEAMIVAPLPPGIEGAEHHDQHSP